MKFPCLILDQYCTTDIELELAKEGINEQGEPLEPVTYSGKCNYQDRAKTIFTTEKKSVVIQGTALIPGDIAPELPTISGGSALVYGVKRRIAQGTKARNPDGTVNYTEVLLE